MHTILEIMRFYSKLNRTCSTTTSISPASNDGDISDGIFSDLSGEIVITFNENIQYIFGDYDYPFFTSKIRVIIFHKDPQSDIILVIN